MDFIEELGNKQRAREAKALFWKMLKDAGAELTDEQFTINKNGTVTFGEFYSFTIIDRKLVMEGPCSKCSMSTWSVPVHSLADIASLRENFRPGKDHRCMDV